MTGEYDKMIAIFKAAKEAGFGPKFEVEWFDDHIAGKEHFDTVEELMKFMEENDIEVSEMSIALNPIILSEDKEE
jgi:hypothetical protein